MSISLFFLFVDFSKGGYLFKKKKRDFPSGPVVKTLPSNAGDAGLIHGLELRSYRSRGQKTTKIETEAILQQNSIKTLRKNCCCSVTKLCLILCDPMN